MYDVAHKLIAGGMHALYFLVLSLEMYFSDRLLIHGKSNERRSTTIGPISLHLKILRCSVDTHHFPKFCKNSLRGI